MEAVCYSRFSDRPNAAQSESNEKQAAYCGDYCKLHEFDIIGEFGDRAMSGKRADNRPELEKALELVCRRKAVLVVYSLSRLARSLKDAILIAERLDQAGAGLASLKEHFDTTSPAGRMIYHFFAAVNQFQREVTADQTSDAMLYLQSNGHRMSGPPPYGYAVEERVVETDKGPLTKGFLIEAPEELVVIEDVIRLHKSGSTYVQIAEKLAGAPNRTRPFTVSTVRNILDRILYPEKRAKRRKNRQRG